MRSHTVTKRKKPRCSGITICAPNPTFKDFEQVKEFDVIIKFTKDASDALWKNERDQVSKILKTHLKLNHKTQQRNLVVIPDTKTGSIEMELKLLKGDHRPGTILSIISMLKNLNVVQSGQQYHVRHLTYDTTNDTWLEQKNGRLIPCVVD